MSKLAGTARAVPSCVLGSAARSAAALGLLCALFALASGPARADDLLPLTDLRYLGRATTWTGCFESLDTEAVNPANIRGNILGFVGTPQNRRVEVEYEVEVPAGVPADVPLVASLQIRCVRREGWEPVSAIANVSRNGAPTYRPRVEHLPDGNLETWQIPLPPAGPGVFRVSVRVGGASYFAGQISRTITLGPQPSGPLTRESWFAARLVDEAADRAFGAMQARGAVARPGLDPEFPEIPGASAGNVIQWKTEGTAVRDFGVQFSVEAGLSDVDRQYAVGVLMRYPFGEGRIQITDPLGGLVAEVPVYACPGVRVVWIPVRFAQAGAHAVKFLDGGAGRSDASVYANCYLKAVTEETSPLLRP